MTKVTQPLLLVNFAHDRSSGCDEVC